MSSILALAARVAMASVLLWAGLEKARAPSAVVEVARRLGARDDVARVAAALLILLELGTGSALLFSPRAPAALAGVVLLAVIFAAAGLIALRRRERIRCGCFGPTGDAPLGVAQLVTLPLWLLGVTLVAAGHPASSDPRAAPLFAVVALTMAALRGARAFTAAREARAERRSAREMLVWLSR